MADPALENLAKLYALAEEDEIYQVWNRSHQEFTAQFAAFADNQPHEIRNFLWGYAEAGRLMYQRALFLACLNMDFPAEKA